MLCVCDMFCIYVMLCVYMLYVSYYGMYVCISVHVACIHVSYIDITCVCCIYKIAFTCAVYMYELEEADS